MDVNDSKAHLYSLKLTIMRVQSFGLETCISEERLATASKWFYQERAKMQQENVLRITDLHNCTVLQLGKRARRVTSACQPEGGGGVTTLS